MTWPFGKARSTRRAKGPFSREKEIPRDEERLGPAPPPPPTAHAPGISVYRFDAIPPQHLLRLDEGYGGFLWEGEEGGGGFSALLVLWAGSEPKGSAAAVTAQRGGDSPARLPPVPGDVLIWNGGTRTASAPPGSSSSFEEISGTSPPPRHHIRRDDLGGRAVPGITGLRALGQLPEVDLAILRLGPPPGARWVFKGIHAVAVFSGRFAAVDRDDVKEIRAGSFARVADPSATLYLEAGNDAALAVALATSAFVAALS